MKILNPGSLILALFALPAVACAQGMFVNEVSNGPSGSKEYIEFVVDGPVCGTVDLRGWIIDDNNGDFSCGPISGAGIAVGHIRISPTAAAFAAVPVGSIILVHNDADLNALVPANDPTDANADLLYVIPYSNAAVLERTSGPNACPPVAGSQLPMGCNATCPATGNSAYSPATYVAGGGVTQVGLANAGDAAQSRMPSGAYFHGVSYGGALLNGGPDGLKVSAVNGSGAVYYFNTGDYRTLANWSIGVDDGIAGGDETPGAANNAANQAFIDALRNCILPVAFDQHLNGKHEEGNTLLTWVAASEERLLAYSIERRHDADPGYETLATIPATQPEGGHYAFTDMQPPSPGAYYRLRMQDENGAFFYSRTVFVSAKVAPETMVQVMPEPADGHITLLRNTQEEASLRILNLQGQVMYAGTISGTGFTIPVEAWPAGLYLYQIGGQHPAAGRFTVQH